MRTGRRAASTERRAREAIRARRKRVEDRGDIFEEWASGGGRRGRRGGDAREEKDGSRAKELFYEEEDGGDEMGISSLWDLVM